jgi:NADH-ubiquinone oxidoreductase chain 1
LWLIIFSLPLSFVWFVSCLAETNRTPFDFAEVESELVSGFNVEYGGGGVSLICLAEYARILLMRLLFCIIFLGRDLYSFHFYIRVVFISFLFKFKLSRFKMKLNVMASYLRHKRLDPFLKLKI